MQQGATVQTTFGLVSKQNSQDSRRRGNLADGSTVVGQNAIARRGRAGGAAGRGSNSSSTRTRSKVVRFANSSLDVSQYLVVQSGVPRKELGKGVCEIRFTLSSLTRWQKMRPRPTRTRHRGWRPRQPAAPTSLRAAAAATPLGRHTHSGSHRCPRQHRRETGCGAAKD